MARHHIDHTRTVGEEQQLRITGQLVTWVERHPYGATTAGEDMSEFENEAFELDGEPISREALEEKFSSNLVEQWINHVLQYPNS